MTKKHILQKDDTQSEHEYQLKLPLNLEVCIPNDDCVRLIRQFVEEVDLTELYDTYEQLPSGNHPTPDILLNVLLYAYHERKDIAAREVARNCKRDINYLCLLEGKGIEAYIKPANYEQRKKKKFAEDISKKKNMDYDAERDFYICKNGRQIKNIGFTS